MFYNVEHNWYVVKQKLRFSSVSGQWNETNPAPGDHPNVLVLVAHSCSISKITRSTELPSLQVHTNTSKTACARVVNQSPIF